MGYNGPPPVIHGKTGPGTYYANGKFASTPNPTVETWKSYAFHQHVLKQEKEFVALCESHGIKYESLSAKKDDWESTAPAFCPACRKTVPRHTLVIGEAVPRCTDCYKRGRIPRPLFWRRLAWRLGLKATGYRTLTEACSNSFCWVCERDGRPGARCCHRCGAGLGEPKK